MSKDPPTKSPLAESTEEVYEGTKKYKKFTAARESTIGSKGKAGPIKAPAHLRVTSRFDYQPDVCKDYKETGFCGYGDSCIFIHDRGDYKSGWQLEKEWEEEQAKKKREAEYDFLLLDPEQATELGDGPPSSDDDDDDLPFACLICRKEFTKPVVTKCGHYFCQKCALARFKKTPKCYACNAPTGGIFNTATALIKKTATKKRKAEARMAKRPKVARTSSSGAEGDQDTLTIEGLADER
ncbi:RNA-splicing factor [Tieghemiomyces parasiticus]|uniref:Pre-mRNA-splicing factor CWC24 n=1 Tax=Tieghemiomyces parasiticus TaxID=78921 RepID=A0A9W8DQ69_9FUNG|nr:RNA-splicing factor [Tieghemiomyces parasiticus]